MKTTKYIFSLLIFLSITICQVDNLDWPNLNKYKNDNKRIRNTPKKDSRVVFIGNSITEGWDWHYPEYFKKKGYINRGISGQTTPQMLIRFKPDVVNLNPKAVVILAGINDIAGNTGPVTIENIAENIFSMAEIALANKIEVFICSVLPAADFPWSPGKNPAQKVIKLNSLLKDYCNKNKLTYVDYYSAMDNGKGGLKVPEHTAADDLVHPNKAGYAVMEGVILKALNN